MIHFYVVFFSVLPLAMMGILLPGAAGARRGMAFGVSLPLNIADSAEVKAALRRFRLRCWLSTGAIAAVLGVVLGFAQSSWLVFATPAAILVAAALIITFWEEERGEARKLAVPTPVVRTAELKARGFGAGPGVLVAGCTALLPLAAAGFWLRSHWASLPQAWPEHWDATGMVDGWGHRTVAGVYGPLLVGCAVLLVTQAAIMLMGWAPGPERSRRQGMVVPMTILQWMLSLGACAMGLLPLIGPASPERVLLATAAFSLLLLGLVFWGLRRCGMLRTSDTPPALPSYDGTPDAGWKSGGLIYYNPSDAAVLVPKRLGVGWTLNFARPLAWIYLSGVAVFVGAIVAFATAR
jgi:uncharacterized membrane protein